jgi:hypothetical protein
MSPRELAIIAVMMDVERPTTTEITKYAYRLFLGYTRAEAKAALLSERKTVASDDSTDRMLTVRLPEDIVTKAHGQVSEMNAATKHRYIMALATTNDENEALALAVRKPGRPRKAGNQR